MATSAGRLLPSTETAPAESAMTAMRSASLSQNTTATPLAIGSPANSRAMNALSTSPTLPGVTVIVMPEIWV